MKLSLPRKASPLEYQLNINLSKAEHEYLSALAKTVGMSRSKFVRKLLYQALPSLGDLEAKKEWYRDES